MRNHSAERIFEKKTQKRTRRRIPRSNHRICGSIANYETPGRIPFAVCVSGIWASLLAGKRHRRRMARSYCWFWRIIDAPTWGWSSEHYPTLTPPLKTLLYVPRSGNCFTGRRQCSSAS